MASRDWIRDPSRQSEEYIRGVNEFLEFAFQNSHVNGKIWCPCRKCVNCKMFARNGVYEHLTDPRYGFLRGYRQWIFHGERPVASRSTIKEPLIHDVFASHTAEEPLFDDGERNTRAEENSNKFYRLVKDNEKIEELKKPNEAETSQSTQNIQKRPSWEGDIFSKVKGPEKRGRVRCMGKIPKCKRSKVSLSEYEELLDQMKHMENVLTNVLSLIQNQFPGEDLYAIIDYARKVTDASSAPSLLSSSSNTNEGSEYGEN